MLKNEIYSDETSIDDDRTLVKEVDVDRSTNSIEFLLKTSKELQGDSSIRFIDQHLKEIPPNQIVSSTKEIHFSCNQFKDKNLRWKPIHKDLRIINLSGNFLTTIDEIDVEQNALECLYLCFNQIRFFRTFSHWPNLSLIDLSYNCLTNLDEIIESFRCLNQLRIVYLNGNPFSLLIDYRIRLVDQLNQIQVLDDIRITTEEKFRSRNYSKTRSNERNYSLLTIRLSQIENIPQPVENDVEWPIEIHRYYLRWNWFQDEKLDKTTEEEEEIPFDKLSNYRSFQSKMFETNPQEYNSTLNFHPNEFQEKIFHLNSFRDFLFHRIQIELIHQLKEYWPSDDLSSTNETKKKSQQDSKVGTSKIDDEKKKKKKNDDLSKLILKKDAEETILLNYFVDLKSFLDGDHLIRQEHELTYQRSVNQTNLTKGDKKLKKSNSSKNDFQRSTSGKSNKEKTKDKKFVGASGGDSTEEAIPMENVTMKSSIEFQLHRFISQKDFL